MKKSWIVLVPFFLLILAPYCLGESLYSGWLPQYSSIMVNGINYSVTHTPEMEVVSFVSPFESAVVGLETCQSMTYFKYCFDANRSAEYDYDRDRHTYEIQVSISSMLPSLTAKTTVSPSDIKLLEDVFVAVTLENTGEKPAEDVEYLIELPLGLVIKRATNDSSNIRIVGDKLYWNGVVGQGLSKSFSYVIWPFQGMDETLRANVTYHYEEFNFSTTTDFKIDVEGGSGIETEIEWEDSDVAIGEKARFSINLTNEYEDKDIAIHEVIITLDDGLSMHNSQRELEKISDNKYKTYISLRSLSSIEWDVEVKPIYSGKLNVTIDYRNYSVNSNPLGNLPSENITLNVEAWKEIVPRIITNHDRYSSSQFGSVYVLLANNNSEIDFVNVNSVLSSDFEVHKNIISPRIRDGINLKMSSVSFRAPEVSKITVFNLSYNGTYETEYGQRKSFGTTKQIEVVPIKKVINITKTATPSTGLKGGDEVLIELWIQNIASERKKDIAVFENYPGTFEKKRGKTSETKISLDPQERQKVYDYTLKIPMAINTEIVSIDSVVQFKDQGFDFVVHKEVNLSIVLPEKPDLTVTKFAPESMKMGEYAEIKYQISNTENSAAKNLIINPSRQREYDLVDKKRIELDTIPSQTSVNVTFTIMPKVSGSFSINSETYTFTDTHGNSFVGQTNALDVTAIEGSSSSGLLILDKATAINQAQLGEAFEVQLVAQNVGNSTIEFSLNDNNANWMPNLESFQSKTLNYSFEFSSEDESFQTQAEGNYQVNRREHFTYSNPVSVVFDPTPIEDAPETNQSDSQPEPEDDAEDQEGDESEEEKGFFAKIFQGIIGFFKGIFE